MIIDFILKFVFLLSQTILNLETQLTLEGPSTSIDVFSFRNACKMASVKSYDTIFSEFYFFINTCLLSKFQDFSASGYRKKYVTT